MLPRRLSNNIQYTPRGSMQHRIKILAPNPAQGPDGSQLGPYLFAESWAYIRALTPSEVNTKDLVESQVLYDVRIPYLAGVTSQMTIVAPTGALWFVVNVNDPDMRQV